MMESRVMTYPSLSGSFHPPHQPLSYLSTTNYPSTLDITNYISNNPLGLDDTGSHPFAVTPQHPHQSPRHRVPRSSDPGPSVPAIPQTSVKSRLQSVTQTLLPQSSNKLSRSVAGASFGNGWQMHAVNQSMGGSITQHRGVKRTRRHQRTPSASTVASTGPASPYMQTGSFPRIVHADASPDSPAYYADQHFAKDLPTPSDTPTESGFAGFLTNAHLAMKDFAIQHHSETEFPTHFANSTQSMSSFGNNSPATPQSGVADLDTKAYSMLPTDPSRHANPNVQLFRTESQVYQDELFNPSLYASTPTTAPKLAPRNTFLSPHRNVMAERLQTANMARSTSPNSAMSRERSPFRDGSPHAPPRDWRMSNGATGTVAHMRQRQKEEAEQAEYARQKPRLHREPTKTISPKDALLEYPDNEQAPLLQDSLPVGYDAHRGGTEQWQTNYNAFTGLQPTSQQNMAFRHATDPGFSAPEFEFQLPLQQANDQIQRSPFQGTYQAAMAARATPYSNTPEFPPSLPSMETSVSDVGPGPSSQEEPVIAVSRPDDTRANTGTYTCTYHGCTQRFDSHLNLQRHKREYHQPQPQGTESPSAEESSPSTRSTASPAPSASGLTSAAILARNSQAGPHRCERTNPSTGKPCNTVFSRPYDLTRHEDTIHNNRKQKVRCPYCREEKSFSRTDALTRHLRVVHPNVESYGKRSRRGD